ncbi:MAG TPA: hypothetical protein VHV79_13185 [Mycobacteriales bacterium]|jgi:hypothetical protein|nr:hypothetical protein [Mycobacteriales bacterium]
MRRTILVAAAVVAVGCAGCGPTPTKPVAGPSASAATVGTVAATSTVSPQHNRSATDREVGRLLALAPLPSGATPVKGPQRKLDGPAMGTPSTSSLIDLHRFWQVPMPMAAVWKVISTHRPTGLRDSGSSEGNGGFGSTEGIAWAERDTSYATGLQLSVSVAANAGGTLIRADGQGEWLDPRPMRDSASGHRLRVTVAGGCPEMRKSTVGVSSPGPGLNDALLPAGTPTAGLICQYGGLNSAPGFGLVRHAILAAADSVKIAAEASRLPVEHQDDVETSCPEADGSFYAIALSYAGRPDVDLGYVATGCQIVANGHIVVNGGLNLKPWIGPLAP